MVFIILYFNPDILHNEASTRRTHCRARLCTGTAAALTPSVPHAAQASARIGAVPCAWLPARSMKLARAWPPR